MTLLAIDTATLTASVALVDGDRTLALCEREVSTHSDVLLELIDAALREAGATVHDLDGVAVGAGPGSFTGLRIGFATAKGLCFAQDKPLWTASSLAALALDAQADDGVVAAIIDAKKNEVFVGCFSASLDAGGARTLEALDRERVLRPVDAAAFIRDTAGTRATTLVGTGVLAYPDELAPAGTIRDSSRATPSATSVGRLALQTELRTDLATAAPTYIRLSEAELKWRKHIP